MLKNFTNLPFERAAAVITNLKETGKGCVGSFRLSRDRHVEAWLQSFAKQEKPHLRHPLYFVLVRMMTFRRMVSSVTRPENSLLSCSQVIQSLYLS